jgi:signal transduction histidine kinase/CheY-like chemotaxis protein
MIDFESFSNFWFLVDSNRIVSMCSQSLEASLGTGVSLLEVVSFSQPKISRDRDFFEQVKGTVINFSIGDIPYPFRATAHRFGETVLFVCWPFLTKIGDIHAHGLGNLMAHPGCIITDVLILKDVLSKQQTKIKSLELEQVEKKLAQQIRINQHQAKLASIGTLAAGIGHEINNPLAIMVGNLSLLQMHLKDDNKTNTVTEKYFLKIEKAIDRITGIIIGLRSLSRTDEVQFNEFSLTELILETEDMIRGIYDGEGIDLSSQVEPGLIFFGNRGRLQQVLLNLLSNAKDSLENRPVKQIHLFCKLINGSIEISVKDTGAGVAPELQSKIFEPFFTTKSVNKGTGIGLALSYSIVKEHGGEILISSQVDNGSLFTVILPAIKEAKGPSSQPENASALITDSPKRFSGTVLIVDDEEDLLEIYKYILEGYGLNVLIACNGLEGFEIFSKHIHQIDFVISDMKMPILDGLGLISKVKNTNYQGPIYLVTGGVNMDISNIRDKVDGVLSKPLKQETIYNLLTKVFTKKV